jgi:hypothetical protein
VSIECSIHDYEGAPDEPCPECQWETLRAQLAECRAVLKDVGLTRSESGVTCNMCEWLVEGYDVEPNHAPDCRLAKCLSE